MTPAPKQHSKLHSIALILLFSLLLSPAAAQGVGVISTDEICKQHRAGAVICQAMSEGKLQIEAVERERANYWARLKLLNGSNFWVEIANGDIELAWDLERKRALTVDTAFITFDKVEYSSEFYRYLLGQRQTYPLSQIGIAHDGGDTSPEELENYIPKPDFDKVRNAKLYMSFPVAIESCDRTSWESEGSPVYPAGLYLLWGGGIFSDRIDYLCEIEKNGHRAISFLPMGDIHSPNSILLELFDGTQVYVQVKPMHIKSRSQEDLRSSLERYQPDLKNLTLFKSAENTPDELLNYPTYLVNSTATLLRALLSPNDEFWERLGYE